MEAIEIAYIIFGVIVLATLAMILWPSNRSQGRAHVSLALVCVVLLLVLFVKCGHLVIGRYWLEVAYNEPADIDRFVERAARWR